jgi:hypothetical protein
MELALAVSFKYLRPQITAAIENQSRFSMARSTQVLR